MIEHPDGFDVEVQVDPWMSGVPERAWRAWVIRKDGVLLEAFAETEEAAAQALAARIGADFGRELKLLGAIKMSPQVDS